MIAFDAFARAGILPTSFFGEFHVFVPVFILTASLFGEVVSFLHLHRALEFVAVVVDSRFVLECVFSGVEFPRRSFGGVAGIVHHFAVIQVKVGDPFVLIVAPCPPSLCLADLNSL